MLVHCFVYLYIMVRLLTFKNSVLSGTSDLRQRKTETEKERERE